MGKFCPTVHKFGSLPRASPTAAAAAATDLDVTQPSSCNTDDSPPVPASDRSLKKRQLEPPQQGAASALRSETPEVPEGNSAEKRARTHESVSPVSVGGSPPAVNISSEGRTETDLVTAETLEALMKTVVPSRVSTVDLSGVPPSHEPVAAQGYMIFTAFNPETKPKNLTAEVLPVSPYKKATAMLHWWCEWMTGTISGTPPRTLEAVEKAAEAFEADIATTFSSAGIAC